MLSTLTRRARVYWLPGHYLSWKRPDTPRPAHLPTCSVCSGPVSLETSKTDEHGKAVHEDCYVLKITLLRVLKN
jgi:hypothetical protein